VLQDALKPLHKTGTQESMQVKCIKSKKPVLSALGLAAAPVYGLHGSRVLHGPWHPGRGRRDAHIQGENVVADVRPAAEANLLGLWGGGVKR
jgi:hypothetical protein